jgi:hypothetical protein
MPVNARPTRLTGAPEGPALLARLRDRLLGQVLGLLEADPAVDGVALVGSLGRGEEDNWSDIDLFILAGDQFIRQFMNEPAASPWARADLLSDGRHNSPAGATSLGTTHIRSGLPLWVDLHVHPADRTPWPADGHVVFERRPVKTGTLPFGEFNASGPRQPATAKTTDEVRQIHLGYVPIAGKYIGRRSPRACEMIRFLGQRRDFNDRDPAAQVRALRGIAKDLSSPSWRQLGDAVASYLDLVEATVQLGGSLSPPGYPGDFPCPAKGAAIQSHNDEDQSMLQRGILGVRKERYGEAELHCVAPRRNRREGDIQLSCWKAAGEISGPPCPRYHPPGGQQADRCH